MITCSLLASSLFGAVPAFSSSTTRDEANLGSSLLTEQFLVLRAAAQTLPAGSPEVQALQRVLDRAALFAAVIDEERNTRIAIGLEVDREYRKLVKQNADALGVVIWKSLVEEELRTVKQ